MTRVVFALGFAAAIGAAHTVNAQAIAEPPPAEPSSQSHALLLAPMLATPMAPSNEHRSTEPYLSFPALERKQATILGLVVGAVVGSAVGLILVETSCDEDPCKAGAWVLGIGGGAAVFGGLGALIGSAASR